MVDTARKDANQLLIVIKNWRLMADRRGLEEEAWRGQDSILAIAPY